VKVESGRAEDAEATKLGKVAGASHVLPFAASHGNFLVIEPTQISLRIPPRLKGKPA
jgi:hypothetical protein